MVDTPCTAESDLVAVARLLAAPRRDLSWAYDLLDELARRRGTEDLHLVVRPSAGGVHVFSHARRPLTPDDAAALASCVPGVHAGADSHNDPDGSHDDAIGTLATLAFDAAAAWWHAAHDPSTGLASRASIEAALGRASACGARYGWSTTAVLLATGGTESAAVRWEALAGALRTAMRTGDEAGTAGHGRALVLLGNAGPDAVRPFIARVRAALDAAGGKGIDLHAATATTPQETVDPAEMWRIARSRLGEPDGHDPSDGLDEEMDALELGLRLCPGVVAVGVEASRNGPVVNVVVAEGHEAQRGALERQVAAALPTAALRVETVALGAAVDPAPGCTSGAAAPHGAAALGANGSGAGSPHLRPVAPRALSAPAPGSATLAHHSAPGRVSLLGARFDPARGESEIVLGHGTARGVGRSPAGPLAGGAQATLAALDGLAFDVPFYLLSAERSASVPGDPVVVVLAARHDGPHDAGGRERLGIAAGADDVEAASRATLSALNRFLAAQRTQQ